MNETSRSRVILLFLLGLPLLALGELGRPKAMKTAPQGAQPAQRSLLSAAPPPARPLDPPPAAEDLGQQAWFADARQQLAELGAVYLRLERWDGDPRVYQFRCDLKPTSIGPPGKTFEALSSTPQAATLHVLQAARRWQASRGDRATGAPPIRVASPLSRAGPGALTPNRRTD